MTVSARAAGAVTRTPPAETACRCRGCRLASSGYALVLGVLWSFASSTAIAEAADACALRVIEPRLADIAAGAADLDPAALAEARASEAPRVHDLAVVAAWYAARSAEDTEAATRATAALFEIWDRHRPAGRLMREAAPALAAEGWPVPDAEAITRRLSQLGDRDAVLQRAAAVADSADVDTGLLREALRGATVMSVRHDAEALAVAGELLERLGDDFAAAETVLFRAELGDQEALASLGRVYRRLDADACAERAALVDLLFDRP